MRHNSVTTLTWLLLVLLALGVAAPAAYCQEDRGGNEADAAQPDRDADADADDAPAPAPAGGGAAAEHSLSWLKLLAFLLVYLPWVVVGDWVSRSSQEYDLGYMKWNSIVFFPFVVTLALGFVLPFVVAYPLMWVVFLGVFAVYTVAHNKSVERHQKVFTGEWFRYTTASVLGKFGIEVEAERKADYEKGPAVDLVALGGDETTNSGNLVLARQSPGYIMVKELIAEMVTRRCDRTMLDFGQSSVGIKQMIDGVWHAGEARERETSDVMLAVMKQLANLKPAERRAKQEGQFAAEYEGTKHLVSIVSQGVQSGERVIVNLLGGKQDVLSTYVDLGMREKLRDVWSELMAADVGLLLFASMPEGGLTTMVDVSLRETDRLMRDFVAVEEENTHEQDIENIAVTKFNAKAGETPATVLPKLIRSYPNVLVVRDFVDAESSKMLIEQVDEGRLIVTTCHARSAAEALLRMLQKKAPHKLFSQNITGVLCTRLIRKLCDTCKVPYEPNPEMLKKLGIPTGKVTALYRPPKGEEIEKPCTDCAAVGYRGRAGIYELLVVNDQVREVLLKQPKLDILQKAARHAGMRTFQEEAILLVAKGLTSIDEAMRVLK